MAPNHFKVLVKAILIANATIGVIGIAKEIFSQVEELIYEEPFTIESGIWLGLKIVGSILLGSLSTWCEYNLWKSLVRGNEDATTKSGKYWLSENVLGLVVLCCEFFTGKLGSFELWVVFPSKIITFVAVGGWQWKFAQSQPNLEQSAVV